MVLNYSSHTVIESEGFVLLLWTVLFLQISELHVHVKKKNKKIISHSF